MDELRDDTVPSVLAPFYVRPGLAADEHIEALEVALRQIIAPPKPFAPQVVALTHSALAGWARIRPNESITMIGIQVARDFRLSLGDLRSTSHEQRILFVRQLAMFLCREITGAPFKSIGEHFRRHHSTVIHAYPVIQGRIRRETAFGKFINKLEGRITETVEATGAAT